MQKVIVVNLNGNAYQLDEPAYQALAAYLDRAAQRLAANPDRAEILADIEQAIADKCGRFLGAHKTVVAAAEVEQILAEMGPVEGDADDASAKAEGESASHGSSGASESARAQGEPVKRLYQIPDGAVVSGVCNGIGAYFDVDPTIVRIIFVLLAFATAGLWVLVYVVLMFVIPIAETPEEHAAAHGLPFNAHELIRQAKQKYAELASDKAWKWEWKRQRRMWRYQRRAWKREWRAHSAGAAPWGHAATASYATQLTAGILAPIFTLLNVALFFVWAIATLSLMMNHTIFGWTPPDDLPLWAALLIMLLAYQVVAWPLHAARRASHDALGYGYGSRAGADTLGLVGAVLLFLLAYHFIPDVHDFVQHADTLLPSFWQDIRQSFR